MQDRARRQGGLSATRLALPQPPVRQLERLSLPALPTAKAGWPSAGGKVALTSVVVPKSALELFQGLWEIGLAHPATLSVGAFGVNPISRNQGYRRHRLAWKIHERTVT